MTTLHDPPMNAGPSSPAATEYHDAPNGYEPRVNVHEPTPTYEKHAPSFPTPHYPPEKTTGILTNGTTSARHSISSARSGNSRRINYNEDVVLGADSNGAGVRRAGTWAHGPGTSGVKENGVSRHASLAERAVAAEENIAPEKYAALTKAESALLPSRVKMN